MKTLNESVLLRGKKVLLRADFDVALADDGSIREPFRAEQQKQVIDDALAHGARVVCVAHISATSSFAPIHAQLEAILGRTMPLLKTIEEKDAWLAGGEGDVALLENVRTWPGEETNDASFAASLARGFDSYINNAFAVCHRAHASVVAVTALLPSYAGPVVEREVRMLGSIISAPVRGKVVVVSGAKGATKVPVVKHLIDKAETIIVGGAIAHDILKMRGQGIGTSISDENAAELLAGVDVNDARLVVPVDFVEGNGRFLDIGSQSVALFTKYLADATLIAWNGPFGEYENPDYRAGTLGVARAILATKATTLVGGGDTIAALNGEGLLDKFSFVSTGGGAMLAFLAGQKLPGLDALGYTTL